MTVRGARLPVNPSAPAGPATQRGKVGGKASVGKAARTGFQDRPQIGVRSSSAGSTFGGRATSGYDAIDDDMDAEDCNGHGTHVAGTVGGTEYGVAKGVQIVGVRCSTAPVRGPRHRSSRASTG